MQGRYATDQPATDIADSLLTNPWTAALVSGRSDSPECYDKGPALARAGLSTWERAPALQPGTPAAEAACDNGCSIVHCSIHGHGTDGARQLHAELDSQQRSGSYDAACASDDGMGQQMAGQAQEQAGVRQSWAELHDNSCTSFCEKLSATAVQDAGSGLVSTVQPNTSSTTAGTNNLAESHTAASSPRQTGLTNACDQPEHEKQTAAVCGDSVRPKGAGVERGPATSAAVTSPSPMSPAAVPAAPAAAGCSGGHNQALYNLSQPGQDQDAEQQPEPKQQGQQIKQQQRYTSWTGNYGHLDSPRFTRSRSTAWQAELHNRRDCPGNESTTQKADTQPMQVSLC